MVFVFITALVLALLVYSYAEFAGVYGKATLGKLFFLTLVYFFIKEYLQKHNLLLNHHYHMTRHLWVEVLGIPPFVVFGHLFVVLMTWQLAVMYLHALKLTAHPVVTVPLVFYFTSAFSLLMENTAWVGGWWSWDLDSWWFYPELLGAPLLHLPWDRPMTRAWGYFVSTFWFMLLVTDLPRKWTPPRALLLVGGLAGFLALAPSPLAMQVWTGLMFVVPLASALLPGKAGAERSLLVPTATALLQPRQARWRGAVTISLLGMIVVCVIQIYVSGKWLAFTSLIPIVSFGLGAYRRWPVWVDCLASLAVVVIGYRLNNGNVLLAGWIVLRLNLVLWALLQAIRWREARSARAGSPAPAPAALTADTPP
jgi:hypothetical protein